ncbi:MAG: arylsulfatase [Acidobacteria bacterium]|nr:MAG: arylsulfatase [Acidobacteriota bacterium]
MPAHRDRRDFIKTVGVAALTAVNASAAEAPRDGLPNIVYILADDLGYGDVSCFNPESRIRTPNLDRLAAQGRTFTDAHAGAAVCSPTRYGILTGRYSWRTRMKSGVLWGYSRSLIPANRMTVASLLKRHNYQTACIGKWHLGLDWTLRDKRVPADTPAELGDNVDFAGPIAGGPNSLGFDYFFGISASLDMAPYVYLQNGRVTALPDRETEQKVPQAQFWRKGPTGADFRHEEVLPKLTEKAVGFIRQNAQRRFFLYLPLAAPHVPVLPLPPFRGKSGTTLYGDFVLQVDDTVRQVLDALKEQGVENNTLVVMTSDNGFAPPAGRDELVKMGHFPSAQFRGSKADIFEGGHRIPFIARWPGHIPANTSCPETICLTDLMATCAGLVGEKLPPGAGEDSFNVLPALLGQNYSAPLREATVHQSMDGSLAIRQGRWKLEMCPGSGGWSDPKPGGEETKKLPPLQLYDLTNDPAETRNLCDAHPEVVRKLRSLLERYIRNGRSTPGPAQPAVDR